MSIDLGQPVDLLEVLDNKENRAFNQIKWSKKYKLPLVSFTINMPGPVKLNKMSCDIFSAGLDALSQLCQQNNWRIIARKIQHKRTGPEGIFTIDGPSPTVLKKGVINIETTHPLGRLMDLDIIDLEGKIISRKAHNLPPRKCILCDDIASCCVRSRRHDLEKILSKMEKMVMDYAHGN